MKDAVVEDQLRAELIEQGRKMNELRADHEKAIYTLTSQLSAKFDGELQRADCEFKTHIGKLLEEASAKDERIRVLEKNEKKAIAERERHQSQEQQLKILSEQLKSVQTDRDFVQQEKKLLEESVQVKEAKIAELLSKLPDLS